MKLFYNSRLLNHGIVSSLWNPIVVYRGIHDSIEQQHVAYRCIVSPYLLVKILGLGVGLWGNAELLSSSSSWSRMGMSALLGLLCEDLGHNLKYRV